MTVHGSWLADLLAARQRHRPKPRIDNPPLRTRIGGLVYFLISLFCLFFDECRPQGNIVSTGDWREERLCEITEMTMSVCRV
ncbi:unnamed protein product [Macrosiphum euphorbiae]|uniref:Uncharacterized protein n=1 Tax=Macrosiphum euphorbiae TaxID=13131 RepID=A0AAV0VQI5_9HEMI|nr:unnamed protein product [Macrosiphum euphorbiae]